MPTETELKIKIPNQEAYQKILAFFGSPLSEIKQTNYYFDTKDHELLEKHVMARVRFDGDVYTATVKSEAKQSGGVQSCLELEEKLASFSLEQNSLNAVFGKLLKNIFSLEDKNLFCIGSIHNIRKIFNLKNQIIELDQTIINDQLHYELEIEADSRIPEFDEYFKNLFSELDIAHSYETSKYARFLASLNQA